MKKRKFNKKVLVIIICVFVLIIIGILFLIYNSFSIKLNGSKVVEIEVNTKYKDKGYKSSCGNVKTIGKVNSKKIGTYNITYKAKYLFFEKSVSRKVKVIDSSKPTIKLKGDSEVTINIGEEYKEEGYEVSDNYDKNLDKKVKVKNNIDNSKEGSYEVVYSVEDSSHNKSKIVRKVNVSSNNKVGTYIKGILIVNKKYHLPSDYNPGVDPVAGAALEKLQSGAKSAGFSIPLLSGFRSYTTQERLYNNYVARDGVEKASTYSAKPGQSEHQSGLAFDIGELSDTYGETPAGRWLSKNAHKYGFIIRYMKGKENITGYQYEPWHVRYVGEKVAKEIYEKGVTLEEYLGVN